MVQFEIGGEIIGGEIDHSKGSIDMTGVPQLGRAFMFNTQERPCPEDVNSLDVATIQQKPDSFVEVRWLLDYGIRERIEDSNGFDSVFCYEEPFCAHIQLVFAVLEVVRCHLGSKNAYIESREGHEADFVVMEYEPEKNDASNK